MSKEFPITNPHKPFPKPVKSAGPIFDKKHSSKLKLVGLSITAIVIVAVIILVLPKNNSSDKTEQKEQTNTAVISTTILKGDSKTKAARRAISEYLRSHTDVQLSPGQRLFMETSLRNTLTTTPLKVGQSIDFKTDTIGELVTAAKALKATTLAKWEAFAKGIKF